MTLQYCSKCVTPSTRPRIQFNDEGVCNACLHSENKKAVDWTKKEQELKAFVEKYRNPSEYDCIVPVSGGKDSHFQAYYAKNVLGLHPLCVTFAPAMPTKIGQRNRRNLIEKVGVDHILVTPDPQVHRKLCKIMFVEHGNPFIPWIQGIFSAVTKVAIEKGIHLLFYGENGEAEYGGATSADSAKLDRAGVKLRVRSDRHNWRDPENWDKYGVPKTSLLPYIDPQQEALDEADVNRVFLGDYTAWNNNHNLYMALNVIGGFELLARRTVGTYTHGTSIDDDIDELYLWLLWPKFGFGRATKSAAPDIREGKLNREKSIELVRLYDGEFPWYVFDKWLDYLQMSEEEFWNVIKKFVGDKENIGRERQEALDSGETVQSIHGRQPAWEKIGEATWRHVGTIHGEERILEIPPKRPEHGDKPGGKSQYSP